MDVMTPKGYLVVTVTGIAMAFVYAGSCWWFPFADCFCCKGKGRHTRDDRKVHRDCRWCRGSGKRLRIGRRIYNKFEQARRRAK